MHDCNGLIQRARMVFIPAVLSLKYNNGYSKSSMPCLKTVFLGTLHAYACPAKSLK